MSPNSPAAKNAEKKGQNSWLDEQLPDLRTLARELRAQAIEELAPADSHDAAVEVAALHLGLDSENVEVVSISSPPDSAQLYLPHRREETGRPGTLCKGSAGYVNRTI